MIIDRWPTPRAESEGESVLRGEHPAIEIVDANGVHVFLQDRTEAGVTYRVCLTPRDVTELRSLCKSHRPVIVI